MEVTQRTLQSAIDVMKTELANIPAAMRTETASSDGVREYNRLRKLAVETVGDHPLLPPHIALQGPTKLPVPISIQLHELSGFYERLYWSVKDHRNAKAA